MLFVRTRSQPTTSPKTVRIGRADQEAVRGAEQEPGHGDREHGAPRLEQPDPEPAVRQLLDRGRDERHDDEERDERRGAARVPAVGHETLLLGRVPVAEDGQHALVDERRRDRSRRARAASPSARFHDVGRRSANSSRFGSPRAIRSRIPSMIPYWMSAADRRRPAVGEVVGRLRVGESCPVREQRQRADEDEPRQRRPGYLSADLRPRARFHQNRG